jgi:hypothetical protein
VNGKKAGQKMKKNKTEHKLDEGRDIEPYFFAFLSSPAPKGFAAVGMEVDSSDTKPFVTITVKYIATEEL